MLGRNHPTVPLSVAALLASCILEGRPIFAEAAPQHTTSDATIVAHRERQAELLHANEAILATADAEHRELTSADGQQIENNSSEFDRLGVEIARRERTLAQRASLEMPRPRQTAPDATASDTEDSGDHYQAAATPARIVQPAQPRMTVPAQARATGGGTNGFRTFGDFAAAVRQSSFNGAPIDPRLMIRNATATSITQESVGADGGFAVPPDYRSSIMTRMFDDTSLLGLCDIQVTSSNTLSVPIDETTPWGTNGIKAYFEREAAALTQTKPSLSEINVRLAKLAALIPVTQEMLEDAAGLDSYLRSKTPEAMNWTASLAIVRGTGVREPLGFLNSGALVTQAAEAAQTADTIVAANCTKMLSRLPTSSRSTAVWLVHPDAEPQLPLMTIGNQPVYLPPGGLADAPLGRLLGRPVIPHEVCSTIGDLGDIMLVDFKQYLLGRKAAGVQAQTSIHLWFDQDLTAFKFTMRLAGQPWWSAPASPRSGTTTRSPFVVLAAR